MKIQLTITAVLSCLALEANAFWRMPCKGPISVQMIDPIVNPGEAGMHVHHILGPDTIFANATYVDLRAGDCTSCQVKEDMSAYWFPELYCKNKSNGNITQVPRIGDVLIYYLLRGGPDNEKVNAFPPGFRMVAGDSKRRCLNATTEAISQEALVEKAIGFNCLNYGIAPEASLFRQTFPPDLGQCVNGLRVEFMFPSCSNGELDSANHKDHMQYPSDTTDGTCPETHPIRLVSLFSEIIYDVSQHEQCEYVFSNGDPTGYGYHADFMNGWEDGILQNAIDTCTDLSGEIELCKAFNLYKEDEMSQCKIKHTDIEGDCIGPMTSLPGCNEIQYGPEPAECSDPAQKSAVPSAPPYNEPAVTQTQTQYTTVDVYATPVTSPCPKQKRHQHHFGHRHKF